MAAKTILDEIIAWKREEVAASKRERPLEQVRAEAEQAAPTRGFEAALRQDGVSLIAEVKQAWIAEATRLELISGPQDVAGLQELKKVLGTTYTRLSPGCDVAVLNVEGLSAIRRWREERKAA